MSNETLLTPAVTPPFTEVLPAFTTQTVVHPDTFNPVHQALLNNDEHLRQALATQGEQVGDLAERIRQVEQISAVDVSRSVGLDWLYRGNRIAIEFFSPTTTLVAHAGVNVQSGIAGDDSIDVRTTEGIKVGADYLLQATPADAGELVRVSAVLSAQRLRLTKNLNAHYGAGARITGSTLTARSAGGVAGAVGAQWVSGAINLGETPSQRAVVIRRSLNAGEVNLFYRDAYAVEWTPRFWSNRRAAGGAGSEIPAGFADYEYIIPMRGDGFLRIEVAGEPVDILHIVGIGSVTGLGGYVNPSMRPAAPAVVNPANAAVDVTERPTLTATGYASPAGNAFAAAQFQISTAADFSTVLHDSGEVQAMTYAMPAGVLVKGTKHYVRGRAKDVAGLVSDWSAVTSFTTKASYAYTNTPAITSPSNGQSEIPEQPTLQASVYGATGGNDTHASSQWQIRALDGTWAAPLHDSGDNATAKTAYTVPVGVLLAGQRQYVARVRYKGASLGWSEWSSDITFTTKQVFAQILGIVLTATGGGAGTWQRVDGDFNPITTTAATFNNHPVYAGVVDQTIDGQAMVKVPRFYVRTGTVPSGAYAGKRYWQVADQPAAGFSLHPAFKRQGAELGQFWLGKYQATNGGQPGAGKLFSVAHWTPDTNKSFEQMRTMAAARNIDGVTGFGMWDIYQLAAIQLLALIEMGGSDSQALLGNGNTSGSEILPVSHSDVTRGGWRGITGLWGNVFQMVDGIRTSAEFKIQVWDTNGNRAYQETPRSAVSGTPLTLATDKAATYDLSMLFIADTSSSSSGAGSIPDWQYSGANGVAWMGGYYNVGRDAGLFYLTFGYKSTDTMLLTGTRIAKV